MSTFTSLYLIAGHSVSSSSSPSALSLPLFRVIIITATGDETALQRSVWQRAGQGSWSVGRMLTELLSWKVHEEWNRANNLANYFGNVASLVKYTDNTDNLAVR